MSANKVAKFRESGVRFPPVLAARYANSRARSRGNLRALTVAMIDQVAGGLEHYLSLLSVRQKLAASNIANVDTPGYRARDIDFQAELSRVLQGAPPEVQEVPGLSPKNDGNNVSLDREARMLAENAMRFSVASSLAHAQLNTVRMAIAEGTNG